MTEPFGARQEPTDRTPTGAPMDPSPAGQWSVPPKDAVPAGNDQSAGRKPLLLVLAIGLTVIVVAMIIFSLI